jgi:hypothetical protein
MRHQQPQAPQACEESVQYPVQQICHNRKFRKRGLLVQAASSTNGDTLKVGTVVRQNMREPREAGSEEDKIMVITKMVLNLMKQNGW